MSDIVLIQVLAIVMVVAGAAAWICQRLGLSSVVGYLVAGAVVGPYTPPFALVPDQLVQVMAQVGLVFLVFSIGLNLSIHRLRRLGVSVCVATGIGALLVLIACRGLGSIAGVSVTQSLFFAGALMVSSSAIIAKVLDELNQTHERPGQMALAMTVLEDVVAILMLTMLTSLIQLGAQESATAVPAGDAATPRAPLLTTLGGLAAFIVLIAFMSLLMVPKMLSRLSEGTPTEIRTLVVTGLLLGLGWLAVFLGYSSALGAFVLGAIIGSTRYKADIDDVFEGVRHIFGAVFFVAVGMLVDFRLLTKAWPAILAVTLLAVVLRPLATATGLIAVGNSSRDALQAALALTPLGEFSFVIARLGVDSKIMPEWFFPSAVGASLLTCLVAPSLTRRAEPISEWWARVEPAFIRNALRRYHERLQRLSGRSNASLFWRVTRQRLLRLGVSLLFVSAVILMARPAGRWLLANSEEGWPLPLSPSIVLWIAVGLIIFAPVVAICRNFWALALILAEGLTQDLPEERRLRTILQWSFRVIALVGLFLWLLFLLPGPSAVFEVVGIAMLLFAASLLVFRRGLEHIHSRFELELLNQLQRASHSAAASAWAPVLSGSPSDWDLELDEVVLPRDTAIAGRNLGQLAIRRRFGCSVVGIDRQGYPLVNPNADTILYPLDKLLILGSTEDLVKVARMLGGAAAAAKGPSGFEELAMETVVVPTGCRVAGKTLLDLDLIRRVGVQVAGIRRGDQRVLAPSGREFLQTGDELLVLGTPPQIARFREFLAPEEPDLGATAA